MNGDNMNRNHLENVFNSMISDVSYIKLSYYSLESDKNKRYWKVKKTWYNTKYPLLFLLTNIHYFEIIDIVKVRWPGLYQDRIVLTSRDILEKEFKIDTRGYRPQEVDKFLDLIIKDYEEMNTIIKELEKDKQQLVEDNVLLKQEVRKLKTKLDVLEDSDSGNSSNADVLRRISKLEKIIYGKE